ncbi:DMT family transporter [Rhodovulum kholense]|uniref:Drug/metabolite transporter (DMT)-like permease n=1 Tax=Rhodovulum kholense TaxID=453584 RepID=A0A8E2VQ08_9RHOB|nr:DMT family transporter [Rhodovulum kholense]PTW51984.1 drug/metabolite transporter (DMT)-like permease [Rhodovulum kholense]
MGIGRPREDRRLTGVLAMALAVAFFTCIDSSAKWLILAGLPALQVVFARYLIHFLLALVVFLPREGLAALRSNSPVRQVLRSVFLLGSTVCNFAALKYLPITVTTTIMFAGPIAVTLLAIPMLGERVGLRRIAAVCTGFLGVAVVMQPWGAAFHPAMLLSLGALTLASLYFVLTRILAGIEAISTQQIWSAGLAALAILPFVPGGWVWPEGGTDWTVFLLIGAFGAAGHIAATEAHRLADASLLAPVVYLQVFLAALAGILVFDTWPTVWTLCGGAIIIASGLYIWRRERAQLRGAKRSGP